MQIAIYTTCGSGSAFGSQEMAGFVKHCGTINLSGSIVLQLCENSWSLQSETPRFRTWLRVPFRKLHPASFKSAGAHFLPFQILFGAGWPMGPVVMRCGWGKQGKAGSFERMAGEVEQLLCFSEGFAFLFGITRHVYFHAYAQLESTL